MTKAEAVQALRAEGADPATAEKVVEFLAQRRWIWEQFEARALLAVRSGKLRIGAKALFEHMREECKPEERDRFKLNNNYPAYIARLFVAKYPSYRGCFELRKLNGLKEAYETIG